MDQIFSQILNTVLMRPYVFVFLLVYLLGCSMHMGAKRAVIFCIAGYIIAWLSEYSSIHNGIPYGYYYYVEHTKGKELWVLGVPFFDSLSYVFLAYASYSMALVVIAPVYRRKGRIYLLETKKIRNSLYTSILGAILFVYLDIIIDPVTLLGDRWFLGKIYGYPQRGFYFGVTVSNFIGWLIVGFLLIYTLQKIDHHLHTVKDRFGAAYWWRYTIGPGLYWGVMVFNIAVTFYIGEYNLALTGVFIVLLPAVFLYLLMRSKLSAQSSDDALRDHISDFPDVVI